MPYDTLGRQSFNPYLAASVNRLINGDMIVAQRGTGNFATDNAYSLDRWRVLSETTGTGMFAQQSTMGVNLDGTSLKAGSMFCGATTNQKGGFFQPIAQVNCWDLVGQPVSLQALIAASANITHVRMAILQWAGTADSVAADPISAWNAEGTNPTLIANWTYLNTPVDLSISTVWQRFKIENVIVGAGMTNLAVFIWSDDRAGQTASSDSFSITDVQLEKGPRCTPFARRLYSHELINCLPYCESWVIGNTSADLGISGCWESATLFQGAFKYFPKRVTPTLSVTAAGNYQVYTAGTLYPATAIAIGNQLTEGGLLTVTVAAGATLGYGGVVLGLGVDRLILSAEL